LTAIIPLSVLFGTFHYLGLGAGIVGWTLAESESTSTTQEELDGRWSTEGVKIKVREWIREGEDKAERVGRRYGWFGWEKESKEQRQERKARLESEGSASRELSADSLKVSRDVANVAAAYLLVKVSFPFLFLLLADADPVSHRAGSSTFSYPRFPPTIPDSRKRHREEVQRPSRTRFKIAETRTTSERLNLISARTCTLHRRLYGGEALAALCGDGA
jgi:hypothetical protein